MWTTTLRPRRNNHTALKGHIAGNNEACLNNQPKVHYYTQATLGQAHLGSTRPFQRLSRSSSPRLQIRCQLSGRPLQKRGGGRRLSRYQGNYETCDRRGPGARFTFRSFLVTSGWETARMVPESQGHSATRSTSQLSWPPSLPSAADTLRNRFPTNTGQLSPSVSTMVSTPAGRAPPCKNTKTKCNGGGRREGAGQRGGGGASGPNPAPGTGPQAAAGAREDPAPELYPRALPTPEPSPTANTGPGAAWPSPSQVSLFQNLKPNRSGSEGRIICGLSGFESVRPHPGKEKARCRGPVPGGRFPAPGGPAGGASPRFRTCPAAPPRHPASRPPTPGRPSPWPAPRHGGGGAADSAPSPFFLLSPQPRPRRSYPASRLPESPAAAAVFSRPADSSSDLVQELSQDTHSLPGPPPRSRFRRSLAESKEGGEARGEIACRHWPGWRGRGERKKQFLGCLLPFPSPFRLPDDPH